MAQKKFYIGEPIQRVLDSPNKPGFENGYPDSFQLNRFVQRGLDALFFCIPELSSEAWQLIMNTLPCADREVYDSSLQFLKIDCLSILGFDDFFEDLNEQGIKDYETRKEAIEKHYQGEHKDIALEVMSLTDIELLGIREVVERFWSKRVYKRNHGFDMTLYDIKRSLVLKPCNELEIGNGLSKTIILGVGGDIFGFKYDEGYGFTHFVNFEKKAMNSIDEEKAFEDFLDGVQIDYLPNTFRLFGYQGSWEMFDDNGEPTPCEEDADFLVPVGNQLFQISDMTPYPGEGEEEFWIEKIAKTIYEASISLQNIELN